MQFEVRDTTGLYSMHEQYTSMVMAIKFLMHDVDQQAKL